MAVMLLMAWSVPVSALIPLLGCICRRGCGMAGEEEICPSFPSRLEGRWVYLVGGTGI